MKTETPLSIDVPRYLRLVRKFPLIPITSRKQLDQAVAVMNDLVDRQLTPQGRTKEEDAYLLVLCELIERYEDKQYPIEPADDADVLADLLEEQDVTQAMLARGTGIAESTISAVLNGKRKLTREQITKVAKWFKISPDLFSAGV